MTETNTPSSEKPLRIPNWIIGLSCLVLVAGGIGLYWASSSGMEDDLQRARPVFEGRSDASVEFLRTCFKDDGAGLVPGSDKVWIDTAGGHRGYNPGRHLFVDIETSGEQRLVRVRTREGEALSAPERAQVQTCLEG